MAGRHASQAVTKYPGIQVMTSSLGVQISQGGGTHRSRSNLVDYFNFQAKAQKAQSSGGKGGNQPTTGYTYSASLVMAIEQGPIDAVTRVWVNGKQYAHGSNGSGVADTGVKSAPDQVGLTLATGAVGQTPWAGLPANHSIGYSGLAIVYAANYPLDSSAGTPNHSFEVVRTTGYAVGGGYTGPDIDPSLYLADFFNNTRTGVPSWPAGVLDTISITSANNSFQKYCLAAGLLLSPLLDQQRSGTDFLSEFFLATNSTCLWSEGLFKVIPYGDTALTGNGVTYTPNLTPVYSLGDDDYIVANPGDPPVVLDIQDQTQAYNTVQFEYLDRTNQYNIAIATAPDAADIEQFGPRKKDPDSVHVIATPSVAAVAAFLYLQRVLYARAPYRFTLGWVFALLEPGDLLAITDAGLGLTNLLVRITELNKNEPSADGTGGTIEVTCEDMLVGMSHSPLYTMQESAPTPLNSGIDPGGVEANILRWTGDFTKSVWGATALTPTLSAATNPVTGATDVTKLTPSTANSVHQIAQSFDSFADANYTYSIYAEPDGYSQVKLMLTDLAGNQIYVSVDLNTGAILAQGTAQVAAPGNLDFSQSGNPSIDTAL